MRCGAKCAGVIFRIIGEKHPQKKTRVSGVQLAACQASSFERFSQMKTDVVGQSVGAGLKPAPIMVVQDV